MVISTKSLHAANFLLSLFDSFGLCTRYGNGRVFGENHDSYIIELDLPRIL